MSTRSPSRTPPTTQPETHETPEQILALAQAWYRRQVEILRTAHGTSWPAHREWITDYLRQEVRQRLIARGWRPRDGR